MRGEASNVPVIDTQSAAELIEPLTAMIVKAGAAILAVKRDRMSVDGKPDGSPVTEADLASDRIIAESLAHLCPDIPVLSEERVHLASPPYSGSFFVIDPLDGTKEFISRNGEFTVNIALIQDGAPLLGVVYAPAIGRLFAGLDGETAYVEDAGGRRPIRCRAAPAEGITVVASRSHGDAAALDAFLGTRKVASLKNAGSSLKLCLVAAGEADLYPRLGRTMEWDIAAGHAVLAAAGGRVTDVAGAPLRYGKPGFENPHFVAMGAGA